MGFYIQGVRIFSGGGFIFRVGNIPGWEIWEIFKSVKYLKVGNIQKWEAFVGYIQVLEIIRSGQGSKGWTAETKEKSREYAFIL